MKRLYTAAVAAMALSVPVLAADDNIAERWECALSDDTDWDNIVVVASVEQGHKSGFLWAAGVTNETQYQVKGLSRNWSFTPNEAGGYDYTFIITASGKGKFYDFSKSEGQPINMPTKTLNCRLDD